MSDRAPIGDVGSGQPAVLEEIATIPLRRGHEIRVVLIEGVEGHAAIDAREWITEDAYRAEDRALRARKRCYVGPTKAGFRLHNPSAVEALTDALAVALIALEMEEDRS